MFCVFQVEADDNVAEIDVAVGDVSLGDGDAEGDADVSQSSLMLFYCSLSCGLGGSAASPPCPVRTRTK